MAEANEKDDDLVAIADDGHPVPEDETTGIVTKPDEDDDEEEDEGEEEQRLGASEEDEDRGELRGKRKEERHDRRSRQKQARERDQKELGFLRARNESLERRFSTLDSRVTGSEVSSIDQAINSVKGNLLTADQVISRAIAAGKGEDAVEAMRIRDGLRDRFTQLTQAKQAVTKRGDGSEPDPALISHAKAWTKSHSWWDPKGGDEDSLVVSAIDTALVNEGLDPKTSDYWDELSKRVAKRLPHRAAKGQRREVEEEEENDNVGNQREGNNGKARGGPRFRTGGRERPLKKNEVYISAERKDAMVEAGVWDDPQLRQRYLKQYAQYDRDHSNA